MSNDLNLDPINRALLGKRFAQWIDIVDKMREDRYTHLMPMENTLSDGEKAGYKYQKLKDLLKYENGSLIADRNETFLNTLRKDFLIWNRSKDYPANQVWTVPFIPDYTAENKTGQYPGVHGSESLPRLGSYSVMVVVNFAYCTAIRQCGRDEGVVSFAYIAIFVKNHAPRIVVCDEFEKSFGYRAVP